MSKQSFPFLSLLNDAIIRLRLVDYEEAGKQRKEEARNSLEGYLYRVRDLLDDSHQDTPFKKCSQESERKAIAEKVSETIAWLHDKGDLAETSQFWDKRNAVECVVHLHVINSTD